VNGTLRQRQLWHPSALARAFGLRVTRCLSVCVGLSSCGQLPVSAARIEQLHAAIERVTQAGALQCAPRELALARAHYDFAEVELLHGDVQRARQHLEAAERNLGAAQVLTPEHGCSAPAPSAGGRAVRAIGVAFRGPGPEADGGESCAAEGNIALRAANLHAERGFGSLPRGEHVVSQHDALSDRGAELGLDSRMSGTRTRRLYARAASARADGVEATRLTARVDGETRAMDRSPGRAVVLSQVVSSSSRLMQRRMATS
jgi:hypothetical protein